MIHNSSDGYIEIIIGPMFSGKSEELIRRTKLLSFAKIKLQVFKPRVDNRWSDSEIVSRAGSTLEATTVKDSQEIISLLDDDTKAVIIDEAQFFDNGIIDLVQNLANKGIRVIVGGLDTDYKDEPFGPIPQLLSKAEQVIKLTGICMKCGNWGTKTQRISKSKDIILVGDTDSYEVRCRKCHDYEGKIK